MLYTSLKCKIVRISPPNCVAFLRISSLSFEDLTYPSLSLSFCGVIEECCTPFGKVCLQEIPVFVGDKVCFGSSFELETFTLDSRAGLFAPLTAQPIFYYK